MMRRNNPRMMSPVAASCLLLLALLPTACAPYYEYYFTDLPHPDPRIEALHVEAFNADLGRGVPQDRAKANRLYLQAAKAGDARSMMNYAFNRAEGVGTEADLVDAFYWMSKAQRIAVNSPDRVVRKKTQFAYRLLRAELTPEQIRQAEARL